jgi:hypothetical protein
MKNTSKIIVSIGAILLAVSIGALSIASFEHATAQMSNNRGMNDHKY